MITFLSNIKTEAQLTCTAKLAEKKFKKGKRSSKLLAIGSYPRKLTKKPLQI